MPRFSKSLYRVAIGFLAALPAEVRAHEGPPYPILMDVPVADHLVSIWGDPDIGEAAFFIVVETRAGEVPQAQPEVSLWVEPISGRLVRVHVPSRRQPLRNRMQFEANPVFDQQDFWNVGFRIALPGAEPAELVARVESTPPGYGPWDMVLYLAPFLLIGGLWITAVVRRKKALRAVQAR